MFPNFSRHCHEIRLVAVSVKSNYKTPAHVSMSGSSPTCSRCGKTVECSSDLYWKSLGRLRKVEWAEVCEKKGFPSDAYKTEDTLHTWVALCDHCYNYKGGWRNYMGMVASEKRAAYPCNREAYLLFWAKAYGAPGLSVQPACLDEVPSRILDEVPSRSPFAPG